MKLLYIRKDSHIIAVNPNYALAKYLQVNNIDTASKGDVKRGVWRIQQSLHTLYYSNGYKIVESFPNTCTVEKFPNLRKPDHKKLLTEGVA